MGADGLDGAAEGAADDLGGLLAGGYQGGAEGDLLQECGDIGWGYYLKVGIGGVVFEAADLGGGVVECQAVLGAELAYGGLVEAFLTDDAEVVLVVEMDEADDSPEVVDPVGVIEWHAPAVGLGRETAQEEYPGVLGQEGFKRVLLYIHYSQRYKMCEMWKRGLSPFSHFARWFESNRGNKMFKISM